MDTDVCLRQTGTTLRSIGAFHSATRSSKRHSLKKAVVVILEDGWKLSVGHPIADGIMFQAKEARLQEFQDRLALDSGANVPLLGHRKLLRMHLSLESVFRENS